MADDLIMDLGFAKYLVYFPESADYLLVDPDHPLYFFDDPVTSVQEDQVGKILRQAGIHKEADFIDYNSLHAGATPYDNEIFVYLISVPGLSFDVLDRAWPIIAYLRSTKKADGKPYMEKMVANTLTGIAHIHEIPGEGTLDFEASFKALTDNGFSGYGSVELYHHVESWEVALDDSITHLSQFV
jgi:hypothetical protein